MAQELGSQLTIIQWSAVKQPALIGFLWVMERELTQNWLAKTNWQTCDRNIENNQWKQNKTQEKLIKTEFIAQNQTNFKL